MLLQLLQLGNQGHWVLAEEMEVCLKDYPHDPNIEYRGTKENHRNPGWWVTKHAMLSDRYQKAKDNLIPSTYASKDILEELAELLNQQRKQPEAHSTEHLESWLRSTQTQPVRKRQRTFIDVDSTDKVQDVQSGDPPKRRKLAPIEVEASTVLPSPTMAVESSRSGTTAPTTKARAGPRTTQRRLRQNVQAAAADGVPRVLRAGPKRQRPTLVVARSRGACDAPKTRAAGRVHKSRYGRPLRTPDRYGFLNTKMASEG
ncbi:hypothetical protein BX600DRAFT_440065 [Xylariales sp. PMI_506]|nr:hypothetical protein BX600DRAFT_440065 [Xylariales sp. PMI_506]